MPGSGETKVNRHSPVVWGSCSGGETPRVCNSRGGEVLRWGGPWLSAQSWQPSLVTPTLTAGRGLGWVYGFSPWSGHLRDLPDLGLGGFSPLPHDKRQCHRWIITGSELGLNLNPGGMTVGGSLRFPSVSFPHLGQVLSQSH